MDWLSFWASVIKSVAWPVAALGIVLLLRKAIIRVLEKLTRLKWKDLEIQVGREVAQAEAEVAAGRPAPELPAAAEPQTSKLYFAALAEVSPRAAVLEGWLPFEVAAGRIGEQIGLSKAGAPIQMPNLIDGLSREHLLTEGEAKALGRLRGIRNRVVHGGESVSAKEAAEYAQLLQEVTRRMEARASAR